MKPFIASKQFIAGFLLPLIMLAVLFVVVAGQ